jgi:hypothetical protein
MLNQLPKNLNLSNSVNEKHLNLLDQLPEIKTTQESSVTNFILIITIFFVALSSFISFLNIKNDNLSTSIDSATQENLNFVASKESTNLELKQDIKFLNDYRQKSSLIKNKYYNFFETLNFLYSSLGDIYLDKLTYTNSDNVFNFRINFYSKNKNLEQDIQKFSNLNKRITTLKMESIEKIPGTADYKYVFNGVIDGR